MRLAPCTRTFWLGSLSCIRPLQRVVRHHSGSRRSAPHFEHRFGFKATPDSKPNELGPSVDQFPIGTVLHRGQRYSLFVRKMTNSVAMPKTKRSRTQIRSCAPFMSDAGVLAKYQNAAPEMKSAANAIRIARHASERRRLHCTITCASVSIQASTRGIERNALFATGIGTESLTRPLDIFVRRHTLRFAVHASEPSLKVT